MMIVSRIRGKIIRTVLCCTTVVHSHKQSSVNSSGRWIGLSLLLGFFCVFHLNFRVSNNLLDIYKVSWKFSGLVREFVVNISYNAFISEYISTKYLAVNHDQLILRLVIPSKCQLTYLLIGVNRIIMILGVSDPAWWMSWKSTGSDTCWSVRCPVTSADLLVLGSVLCMFSLGCHEFVVKSIVWKDSSLKWPIIYRVGC